MKTAGFLAQSELGLFFLILVTICKYRKRCKASNCLSEILFPEITQNIEYDYLHRKILLLVTQSWTAQEQKGLSMSTHDITVLINKSETINIYIK